jgi:Zn-dependent protease with chaperone function
MNNPLAELKDIHTPDGISLWPPAYGWWLLTFILILLLVWLSRFIYQRRQQGLAKRQAIQELKKLTADSSVWRVELNSLLKRLLLTYQPTLAVQQLHGEQFTRLLTEALPLSLQANFQLQMSKFQQGLYQLSTTIEDDFASNKNLIMQWVKAAKLNNKKVKQRLTAYCEQVSHRQQGAEHV